VEKQRQNVCQSSDRPKALAANTSAPGLAGIGLTVLVEIVSRWGKLPDDRGIRCGPTQMRVRSYPKDTKGTGLGSLFSSYSEGRLASGLPRQQKTRFVQNDFCQPPRGLGRRGTAGNRTAIGAFLLGQAPMHRAAGIAGTASTLFESVSPHADAVGSDDTLRAVDAFRVGPVLSWVAF